MNSLLKVLLTGALLIGIGIFGINKYNATQEQYEYRLAKERLRSEFLERAPQVWGIQEPERYQEESRALFKWYYGSLTQLYNRFPQFQEPDAYLKGLEQRRAAGSLSESDFAQHQEAYDQVQEIWELIRSGSYAPALSASDNGLRIDFLEFKPGSVQGERAIVGRFVLWGAQRQRSESRQGKATLTKVDVQATFPDVMLSLSDQKGKAMGELSFSMPSGPFVPFPESRFEDFPPMAYVGAFAFPLLPAEAESMEMEAGAATRSPSGAEIRATYSWKQAVPSGWRIGAGETWEGADTEIRDDL